MIQDCAEIEAVIEASRRERIHSIYVTAATTKSTASRSSKDVSFIVSQALSMLTACVTIVKRVRRPSLSNANWAYSATDSEPSRRGYSAVRSLAASKPAKAMKKNGKRRMGELYHGDI